MQFVEIVPKTAGALNGSHFPEKAPSSAVLKNNQIKQSILQHCFSCQQENPDMLIRFKLH